MSEISQGAVEIVKEARWPGRDREKIEMLIDKHGIGAAAEALELLGQIASRIKN